MKIGDKYVDAEDMETLVEIVDIIVWKQRSGPTGQETVRYVFEGTEKKNSLPKDQFMELYRPFSKLDALLTED